MGLVPGVLALNVIFCVVGYCLLGGALRGLRPAELVSYCGVALLVGAAAVAIVLQIVAVAGLRPNGLALGLTGVGLAALGVGVAAWAPRHWLRASDPPPVSTPWGSDSRAEWVATALAGGLAAVLILTAVAAFRTSATLDDTWTFWLPRGLSLEALGLDTRRFTADSGYVPLAHPDYPLVWSLTLSAGRRLVGATDLRAANGQLGIMFVAFLAAAGRLLWGWARPWIVFSGLLLLASAPELLRQTQAGGADVPLAIYLSLFALAAGLWLLGGGRLLLLLACLFAATALLTKSEGAPQLLLFTAVLGACGLRAARRRTLVLGAGLVGSWLLAAPWLIWRQAQGVRGLSDIHLGDALKPSYLLDRTDRIGPAAETLARHLTNPREWLVIVPLALLLSLFVAVRRRRAAWVGPAALVAIGYAFWIWVNWADPSDLDYRLGTSSYRVIDALVFAAGLAIPLMAEAAFARRTPPPPSRS